MKRKLMKRNSWGFAYILLLILLVPVVIAATYVARKRTTPSQPKPEESEERQFPASLFKDLLERGKASPTPTIAPGLAPEPTPTPKPGQITQPTSTPTPTPVRDTSPPVITQMTGPGDGSTVDFNNFCFPMYFTDNVSKSAGILVRIKFDSDSWSDWSTANVSPCFNNVGNGSHSFSAQAKDEAGNLSAIITRNFTVQVPQDITVTYSGQIYRDENCNGVKDSGEGGVAVGEINFFQIPEWYIVGTVSSDSSGSYSFSKTIKENESITLKAGPVSPSGYKSNPHFTEPSITLNSSNPTTYQELPQVPNESVGQCY